MKRCFIIFKILLFTFPLMAQKIDDPLIRACKKGEVDSVKQLLEEGAKVNSEVEEGLRTGMTPLLIASKNCDNKGSAKIVKLLLKNGANVDKRVNDGGFTSLMYAVKNGIDKEKCAQVVKVLIENGADVNAQLSSGKIRKQTCLHLASSKRAARLLIENGAKVNAETSYGVTPLMSAAADGYKGMVALLLKEGADVNATTDQGRTALMEAAVNGNPEVTELLIQKGAKVSAENKEGNTALMLAVSSNNLNLDPFSGKDQLKTAMTLIRNGADVNQKGPNGYTPLIHICRSSNAYPEYVEKLLDNGAKVGLVAEKDKMTALKAASKQGHQEIVKILKKAGAEE